jgi:pilus assembly protein Flp/PilA
MLSEIHSVGKLKVVKGRRERSEPVPNVEGVQMIEQTNTLLTYVRARLGLRNEEGQALVEYALIISLVALIAVGGLTFAGGRVSDMFSAIGSKLNVSP